MNCKHIILIANDTTYTYNLRREIICELRSKDCKVTVIAEKRLHCEKLNQLDCSLIDNQTGRHGTNPLQDIGLLFRYMHILWREKPDIVLSFNIKPNVYGGMACRLLRIPYMANITGLGTAVEFPGMMQKITTSLYKWGTWHATHLFFQNEENLHFFRARGMINPKTKAVMLPGSGVALDQHVVIPYPDNKQVEFLFAARILKEKGIDLYLEAARTIHQQWENTVFHICGGCDDEAYLAVLNQAELDGYIEYHGEQKNMIAWFSRCHCLVHPSYYPEGMSNVLLEAAASGRPVIATDRSGCREIVNHGESGFLIPIKNVVALIKVIEKFMSMTMEERKQMGLHGREKVEREFDRQIVVKKYMEAIESL